MIKKNATDNDLIVNVTINNPVEQYVYISPENSQFQDIDENGLKVHTFAVITKDSITGERAIQYFVDKTS